MGLNVRLTFLKLRQKLNFRLVKLLLLLFYIGLTVSFVVYNFADGDNSVGEYLVQRTESGQSVRDRFHEVGGLKHDFRKDESQDNFDLPTAVKDFESLAEKGKGENGAGVHLSGVESEKAAELQKVWAFNKIVSDKISLWRALPDMRSGPCKAIHYDTSRLPSSSVVIIFNNEALSALLRTVWSVLDRTPAEILHEVVLVDDGSNHTDIVETLPLYMRTRLPPKVRLVRNKSQLGLIRARVEGARASTGDIVVFLDSHCEASKGWLEPMAERIKQDPTVVQIPRIDMIDATSLSYYGGGGGTVSVGGFTWSGHFTWEGIPSAVAKKRKNTDPAKTATMAGGLFAINREFFWRIGGYDEGMFGWGGENLELSFRVWRCGGSMEIHPCSSVGHIFRPFHPYHIPHDSHGINTARMAEVWMDEFKRFFYMHRADLIDSKDIGDLSERHAIKDRLQCKSFRWFLENVYPHKFIYDEQSIAWGRMRANNGHGARVCIDHLQRDMAHKLTAYDLGEYPCHPFLGSSQYYAVSKLGAFRNEYMCGQVSSSRSEHDTGEVKVIMAACDDNNMNQRWTLSPEGELKHDKSGLCLDMGEGKPGQEVSVEKCDGSARQVWKFDFYEDSKQHWRPNVSD